MSEKSKELYKTIRTQSYIAASAAIKRLCDVGAWPRPYRSRILRIGYDYFSEEVDQTDEVKTLISSLIKQEIIKDLLPSGVNELLYFQNFWHRLLVNILSETETSKISLHIHNRWFNAFWNEIHQQTATWRSVDILSGIKLQRKIILDQESYLLPANSLGPNWLGSLISKHDNCFNPEEFIRNTLKIVIKRERTAFLVTTISSPKNKYDPTMEIPEKIRFGLIGTRLIEAIRLNNAGAPYIQGVCKFELSSIPFTEPLGYRLEDSYRPYEEETEISGNQIVKIKRTWKQFNEYKYSSHQLKEKDIVRMNIARNRFFRSYDTYDWYGKILELTISLEALFSPRDNVELSHRIALRCAWLLEMHKSKSYHSHIYNCVRSMYEIRSGIVHGARLTEAREKKLISHITGKSYERSKDWNLRKLAIESAREIVRNALKACNNLSKLYPSTVGPVWPFPDDFDKNIIVQQQQKIWQKAAGL